MLSALSLSKVNNYIFGQAKKTWDLHEVELYLKLPLILNPDVSSNNTGHYLPPGTESEIGFFYTEGPFHSTISCINPLAEMSSSADNYQVALQKQWPLLITFTCT